ncbi:MAG: aminotransferase class IV [Fulvivirga sp.]|uniref:aminotransferase class IV n=1 Tax=Fulvivirga sp. TaxID=1931237 RepID=UPI0032EB7EE8
MKYIYNNKLIDEEKFITPNNRSFLFGDGVFETIMVFQHEIRFIEQHHNRISAAMKAIGLNSSKLTSDLFKKSIEHILEANSITSGRVKFMVWRKEAPNQVGYSINTNDFDFLISIKNNVLPEIMVSTNVGLSNKVRLSPSVSSSFKTMNSLPYVLAGIEKTERNLDDIVLTDFDGNISECSSSNLFWIKDSKLFTPPLDTGCIHGIMRKAIMNQFNVTENKISYDTLKHSETVFSTNVARLQIFKRIDSATLETSGKLLAEIKQLWVL